MIIRFMILRASDSSLSMYCSMSIKSFRDSYSLFKVLVIVLYEHEIPHPAVTYTPELIPGPVNNTLLPIFSSCPSETLYFTYPPITTSYKNQPIFT